MSADLLDLSTLVDRDTIRVKSKLHPDGKTYELLGENELSLYAAAIIRARIEELQDLDPEAKPTAAQERRHTEALRKIIATLVVGLEQPVLKALSDLQMLAILNVFQSGQVETAGNPEGR